MEGKKIIFGFTKTIKRPQLQLNKISDIKSKVELITCLEGKEIKLVKENKVEDKALIIPCQNTSKTSRALESLKMRKAVLEGLEVEKKDSVAELKTENGTLDNSKFDSLEKRAITELLIEARRDPNSNSDANNSKLTLVVKPEDMPLDGAKESTIDDYESIPINQFGMAMLRGMGLTEEIIKKRNVEDDILCPRPKGMGLGADKAIKRLPVLIPPEENEKLEIKKNSYVKILAGKHKSQYGQIEAWEDHTGRLIVKLALGGVKESLGEYLLQPVSKKEFETYGKVINSVKYEEYKRKENVKDSKYDVQENLSIKNEPNIKKEYDDDSYNKHNQSKDHNTKLSRNSSEKESYSKLQIKKDEIKIKTEKNDLNHKGSSSHYYSPAEHEKSSKSYRNIDHNEISNDNFSSSKQYNQREDKSNCKSIPSKEQSRSRNLKRNFSESDSDSSNDSSEKRKHKSSKKKSSKSKKSKKNKHKYNASSEDEKKHKKKTKKSRKSRSRSRSRHRR